MKADPVKTSGIPLDQQRKSVLVATLYLVDNPGLSLHHSRYCSCSFANRHQRRQNRSTFLLFGPEEQLPDQGRFLPLLPQQIGGYGSDGITVAKDQKLIEKITSDHDQLTDDKRTACQYQRSSGILVRTVPAKRPIPPLIIMVPGI